MQKCPAEKNGSAALNVEVFNTPKKRLLIYANQCEFGLLFAEIRVDWRAKRKPHLSVVLPKKEGEAFFATGHFYWRDVMSVYCDLLRSIFLCSKL